MVTAVGFLLGSAGEDRIFGLKLFCLVLLAIATYLIVQEIKTRIDQRRNRNRYAMSILAEEYATALVTGRPVRVESLIERCPEEEHDNLRRVCRAIDGIHGDRMDKASAKFARPLGSANCKLVEQIDQIGRSKGLS